MGPGQVRGPDAGGEPIAHAVGDREGLVLGVEGVHGDHGTEDLLAGGATARGEAADDRRLEEEALAAALGELRRRPAAVHGAPLGHRQLQVAGDLVPVCRAHQGPEPSPGHGRVAGSQRPGPLDETRQEAVVDRPLDQHARAAEADLALVGEGGPGGAVERPVEVGVGEDHRGVLAAQLQAELLEQRGARGGHGPAGGGAAGERDGPHPGVGHQGLADLATQAVQEVEDPRRRPDLGEEARQAVRGQRRQLAGLGDEGIAHRQGRRDLPGQQVERQVPGGDQADHAEGLAQGVVQRPLHVVGVVAVVADGAGEEAEVLDRPWDVDGPGQVPGLALVLGLQRHEVLGVGLDPRGDRLQQLRPLGHAAAPPAPVPGGPGSQDGGVDVFGPRPGDAGQQPPRGGLQVVQQGAGGRGHEGPADEVVDRLHGACSVQSWYQRSSSGSHSSQVGVSSRAASRSGGTTPGTMKAFCRCRA